jgi:nitrogen fixation/metabolism regulation signal transduction histidine kinase
VLLTCYPSKHRLPKHKGNSDADKKKRTLTDIVKLCLDPDREVPIFYAIDLARVPPVGVQHIDVSALLQEVAALRAEVRAAVAVKEEIASVRAAVASLASSSLAVENVTTVDVGVPTVDVSGARSAA